MTIRALAAMTPAAQLSGNELVYLQQNSNDVRATTSQFGRPLLTLATALTASSLPNTFMVSGFTTDGDAGARAIYSNVGSSSSNPMAFSIGGTFLQLVLDGRNNAGWFGAKCDVLLPDGSVNPSPTEPE